MKMIYTPSGELVEVESIYYGVAKIRYSDNTRVNVPENLLEEAPEEDSPGSTVVTPKSVASYWKTFVSSGATMNKKWCPHCENFWTEPSNNPVVSCPYCGIPIT